MTRDELAKRAAVLGIKSKDPAQVLRMRIYREGLRKRTKPAEPDFEVFGMRLTAAFQGDVKDLRRRLSQIARQLAATRMTVERLLRSKLPFPRAQLETIEGAVMSLEERVQAAMPRALCPYCKGIDQIQTDCRGCAGLGLVSIAQWNQAPKRLKEADVVISEGRERPVSDFAVDPKRDPFGQ